MEKCEKQQQWQKDAEVIKKINVAKGLTWLQKMDKILEYLKTQGCTISGLTLSPDFNKDGKLSDAEANETIAHELCIVLESSRDPKNLIEVTDKELSIM